MAETQSPSVGYKDEFHLYNGTTLYKLRGVKELDWPQAGQREQEEVTDLDAPDWTRQYVSTFKEDQDFEVLMNWRPQSTTDLLCKAAVDAGDIREFKTVVAIDGVPAAQVRGTCRAIGYAPGRISVGSVKEASLTYRVVAITAYEVYSA